MEIVKADVMQKVSELPPGQVVKMDCGGWWMLTDEILGEPMDVDHYSVKAVNLTGGNTMWILDDCLVRPVLCRLEILSEGDG